ncbi:MAG: DUF192 domain-containing protein [Chloroflexi bacterium]|nr:DUF192 domain-containing protein [Chloroflexota bacterium]
MVSHKLRLRIFHVIVSFLVMVVVLLIFSCWSQGSGATPDAVEESPSPVSRVATETAAVSATASAPTAEATLTATPAAPSLGPRSTATPPTAALTTTPVPTLDSEEGPRVNIGSVTFAAEIANTGELRTKGLSERDALDSQTGMLFIFDDGRASAFWMKGMRFPLDFVWIGSGCTVVAVTKNVPNVAPETPVSALPLYKSFVEAEYNLEINAGEVEKLGIGIGDPVTFEQINVEGADC